VSEEQGDGPTIVLMHGFPDNHHLYDRLVPYLRDRHVVAFDFLGWGESDKPSDHSYTFAGLEADLDAVVHGLELADVQLVVHDASGPTGINWALDHPERVASIVALNTFYCLTGNALPNPPEAIRLFSDPAYARLTAHFARSPKQFRWLYDFQVGGFIRSDEVRDQFVPLLYEQFEAQPSTLGPFLELNRDLNDAVIANTQRIAELGTLDTPIRFAFGEWDPYLDLELARRLAAMFVNSDATPVGEAGHFPQLDAPEATASAILNAPRRTRGR
jgi:pimeloyl-ACP methyl ester carboxylesterase